MIGQTVIICFMILAGLVSLVVFGSISAFQQNWVNLQRVGTKFLLTVLMRTNFQFCFMVMILLYIIGLMFCATLMSNQIHNRKLELDLFEWIRSDPESFIEFQKEVYI